jgi:hypothetical protein
MKLSIRFRKDPQVLGVDPDDHLLTFCEITRRTVFDLQVEVARPNPVT